MIVVVGGCGQLGECIVRQLEALRKEVVVFDVRINEEMRKALPSLQFVEGSILDLPLLSKTFQGAEGVIHTASLVDFRPYPSPKVREINYNGTLNVIEACRNSGVPFLVYTSSIDVVFNGEPVINGNEDLPYARNPMNGYIESKRDAEIAILDANSEKLKTCAIRPSHIFGEKDPTISVVVDLVSKGEVPFRFGEGLNDYVYVENCALAHITCLQSLQEGNPKIPGNKFFVSDHHTTFWNFVQPHLQKRNLSVPTKSVPVWLMYIFATIIEFGCWIAFLFGFYLESNFTKYTVMAVGQDYCLDSGRIKEAWGFCPRYSYQEAVQRILDQAPATPPPKTIPKKSRNVPTIVLVLHLFYGMVTLTFGTLLFLNPESWASLSFPSSSHSLSISSLFLPPSSSISNPGPISTRTVTLCQTAGLIYGVLGLYSLTASLFFSLPYFKITWVPRLVSSLFYFYYLRNDLLPLFPFLSIALLELFIGSITALSLSLSSLSKEGGRITIRRDWVTIAQLLHGILSGIFAFLMSVCPHLLIPVVFPQDQEGGEGGEGGERGERALLAWGYVMGNAEFFMTWTYCWSAFVFQLEGFGWLSVLTRFGSFLVLGTGFLFGLCNINQMMGVLPDQILALFSFWALRRSSEKRK